MQQKYSQITKLVSYSEIISGAIKQIPSFVRSCNMHTKYEMDSPTSIFNDLHYCLSNLNRWTPSICVDNVNLINHLYDGTRSPSCFPVELKGQSSYRFSAKYDGLEGVITLRKDVMNAALKSGTILRYAYVKPRK